MSNTKYMSGGEAWGVKQGTQTSNQGGGEALHLSSHSLAGGEAICRSSAGSGGGGGVTVRRLIWGCGEG